MHQTDGGKSTNIVPDRAAEKFSIWVADRDYLDSVAKRVYNVARGAALSVGAEIQSIMDGETFDSAFC